MRRLIFVLFLTILAFSGGCVQASPTMAPDGQQGSRALIAYLSQGDLWLVREDGSDRRQLSRLGDVQWFAWSPRGDQLLLSRWRTDFGEQPRPDDGLYLLTLDGGAPRHLVVPFVDRYPGQFYQPMGRWSRDGARIAAAAGPDEIFVLDVLTSDTRRLLFRLRQDDFTEGEIQILQERVRYPPPPPGSSTRPTSTRMAPGYSFLCIYLALAGPLVGVSGATI
jgi:hypothetical protein